MSRSASPSIAQFFKTQRKRPRTGKEEGVVTASKKLLLEEGIVATSAYSDDGGSGTDETVCMESVVRCRGKNVNNVLEKEGGQPLQKVSPVKFLKVGSLSPKKKSKTLTTEQVAKLLKRKNKLKDLKSALEGINQCQEKLNEFRRTVADANSAKVLVPSPAKEDQDGKEEKVAQSDSRASTSSINARGGMSPTKFYSPSADRVQDDLARLSASKVASPSKLVNMNTKVKKRLLFEEKPSEREGDKKSIAPAYQRFHNLAQKTPSERGTTTDVEADLPLPYNFKILKELFIATETVIGIMKSRKEILTFPKLKNGVLELVRKVSLRERHLAQIATVLPGCYTFGLEKVGQEMHIKLSVEEMLPSVVCARRKAFHSNLIKICMEHHKKFLLELVPPIVVPSDKQITRWHPSFKLDEIPDIVPEENTLPVKPAPEKISTAREVIAKAKNILDNGNPRMKQAVKNLLNKSDTVAGQSPQPTNATPTAKSTVTTKNLKGVSQSLLEKIRNRERAKLLTEMTRTPGESKKLQMLSKMPNFIKIIRNMMVADKKVALPMDTVVNRISHSVQSMSAVEAESHIRLLVTVLPNWIKIHKLAHSTDEYVKIDKTTDINTLLDEMNAIIKKHSS